MRRRTTGTPSGMSVHRHPFAFTTPYRLPALLCGVTPATAWVDEDDTGLSVRFGPWHLATSWANVAGVERTGGFAWLKTAGPPHLSFADRGITFATNGDAAVCLSLHRPVPGLDPTRRLRHPGVTLTVADPDGFADAVRRRV